jgi:hypothetical protein
MGCTKSFRNGSIWTNRRILIYHECKLLCVYFGRSVQSNQRPRSLPFQWFRARKVASWNGLNDSGKLPSRVDVRTLPCSIANSVCFATTLGRHDSWSRGSIPRVSWPTWILSLYCPLRISTSSHRVGGKKAAGGTSWIEGEDSLTPQAIDTVLHARKLATPQLQAL